MKIKSLYSILSLVALQSIYAQYEDPNQALGIGTDSVIITKQYDPDIIEAYKQKTPPIIETKKQETLQQIEYSILEVPVVSTFKPTKGRAVELSKTKSKHFYEDHVSLGYGNYHNIFADAYINHELDRYSRIEGTLHHRSSQGGIKDVDFNNSFYDSDLEITFFNQHREYQYHIGGIAGHHLMQWYGLGDANLYPNVENKADFKQQYMNYELEGGMEMYDGFFRGFDASYTFVGDAYKSNMNHFKIKPSFDLRLSKKTDIWIDLPVDFMLGKFLRYENGTDRMTFHSLKTGISPYLRSSIGKFSFTIGAEGIYNDLSNNLANNDIIGSSYSQKANFELGRNLYLYPKFNASIPIQTSKIIAFTHINGGLEQNSFQTFSNDMAFIAPNILVLPTHKPYDATIGIKGNLSTQLTYKIDVNHKKEVNKALFRHHPGITGASQEEDYELYNSFTVAYDDVQTTGIGLDVNYDFTKQWHFTANLNYSNYKLENEKEAWNLPNFTSGMDIAYDTDFGLHTQLDLFYVGARKDINTLPSATDEIYELSGYADVNLGLRYGISPKFSVFVEGKNLVSGSYERWQHYNVQGLQVLGGLTYRFDL